MKQLILTSGSVTRQVTVCPFVYLYDTPYMGLSISSTNYIAAVNHLMMTMVHVDLSPSGAEFWYGSFWGLVACCFSIWSRIFYLYRLLHILLRKVTKSCFDPFRYVFSICTYPYLSQSEKILWASWLPIGDNQFYK